jgi:hypothetical protein
MELARAGVALCDLVFDPHEANNLADRPRHAELLAEMQQRLDDWQAATDDPLRNGEVPAPPVANESV